MLMFGLFLEIFKLGWDCLFEFQWQNSFFLVLACNFLESIKSEVGIDNDVGGVGGEVQFELPF